MEKTLNEQLLEKIRLLQKKTMRRPMGMRHMHGMHRPPMPEGSPMKGHPEGEPHKHHPHRFPRERILAEILDAGEQGIHQKELAERRGVNPSSMSELIDKLEADRYIERTVDPADKRATLITLTEKGKARAWEVMDERAAYAENIFRSLTEDEKKTLLDLLDKITAEEE